MEMLCFKCGVNPRRSDHSYCVECRRTYQNEWMKRQRAGLPTRTRVFLSPEERKRRKNERNSRWGKERYIERKRRKDEKFGIFCGICGNDDNLGRKRLFLHKKDGLPHKCWSGMINEEFEELIESNDYIKLCYECHKLVHGCMKLLNMTWSDIEERLG